MNEGVLKEQNEAFLWFSMRPPYVLDGHMHLPIHSYLPADLYKGFGIPNDKRYYHVFKRELSFKGLEEMVQSTKLQIRLISHPYIVLS